MEHPIVGLNPTKKKVWYLKLGEECYEVEKAVSLEEGDRRVIEEVLDVLGVVLIFKTHNPRLENLFAQANARRAQEGKTPVEISRAATLRPNPIPWIFGPSYSGKSTLARALSELGFKVSESDDLWNSLTESAGVSRKAWRPEHPQHKEWAPLYQRVREQLAADLKAGGVVFAHDPPPYPYRGMELITTDQQFAHRVVSDVLHRGTDQYERVASRLEGLIHSLRRRNGVATSSHDQVESEPIVVAARLKELGLRPVVRA